jgi:hypothetical protein
VGQEERVQVLQLLYLFSGPEIVYEQFFQLFPRAPGFYQEFGLFRPDAGELGQARFAQVPLVHPGEGVAQALEGGFARGFVGRVPAVNSRPFIPQRRGRSSQTALLATFQCMPSVNSAKPGSPPGARFWKSFSRSATQAPLAAAERRIRLFLSQPERDMPESKFRALE